MLILSALCFVLPMRASFIYLLSAILLIIWMAEHRRRERLAEVLHYPISLAFLAYYSTFLLAMLWSDDKAAGWQMVDRHTPLLLFLLFWSSAEPRYQERYISAFLAGLAVCAVLAHYNWLQLHWFPEWPRGIRVSKSPGDTAPFVDRIMYSPILALGAYLSLRRAVFSPNLKSSVPSMLISILLLSNLAFSDGRAGLVMFSVLCIALAVERIKRRGIALLSCAILFPTLFGLAYSTLGQFRDRVDAAVTDVQVFDHDPNTSVGLRMVYWSTSARIFLDNPIAGVGSGDFEKEYARMKPAHWQSTPDSFNPHNQFLLTAATTGVVGLIALLSIFGVGMSSRYDARTRSMLAGFAVVCMFESYLWRSNTSLAFSAMLAVLMLGSKLGKK